MADRPSPSFLIFRDKEGGWRWNFVGAEGIVVAGSRVAYKQRTGCIRAIRLLQASADAAIVGRKEDMGRAEARSVPETPPMPGGGGENILELTEEAPSEEALPEDGERSIH